MIAATAGGTSLRTFAIRFGGRAMMAPKMPLRWIAHLNIESIYVAQRNAIAIRNDACAIDVPHDDAN